jgi:hypothetical protein
MREGRNANGILVRKLRRNIVVGWKIDERMILK